MQKEKFIIKVPGTSANMGPGFDLMGIALQIYNHFHFEVSNTSKFELSLVDGSPLPFPVKENLIETAYRKYESYFLGNHKLPPFDVAMEMNLPIGGGLGSSASAIVAGFLAAKVIHKTHFSEIPLPTERDFLTKLGEFEGHPDNTIPAFLGGLVFSYFTHEGLVFFKKVFPEQIKLYLCIPNLYTDTNTSRKKLPEQYKMDDIVYNMSRIATWIELLNSGNLNLLCNALEDKLHTPYRVDSNSYLSKLVKLLRDEKIHYSLSGSGPSLLLYIPEEKESNFLDFFYNLLDSNFPSSSTNIKVFKIHPCQIGTEVYNHTK